MRKNLGAKHLLYPQPVFIISAYGADGVPNAMNAAWGGISEEDEISICVSPEHKTTENILFSRAFAVNIADEAHIAECDYLGIVSGNEVKNKLAVAGLHTEKSKFVNAPVITELPISVECRLRSYDPDTCRLVGEIMNVSCDENIFDENGRVDPARAKPVIYDPFNKTYLAVGDKVGKAFFDGIKLKV